MADLGVNNNVCKCREKIKDMIQIENTLQNVRKHNGVITILTEKDVATLVDGVMVIEAWRF
jgi:hypothetical protein